MPYMTRTTSGLMIPAMAQLVLFVVRNSTGADGTVEIIDDVTNVPASHVCTIAAPGTASAQPPVGFNCPPNAFVLKRGLWVNITGVTEVTAVWL